MLVDVYGKRHKNAVIIDFSAGRDNLFVPTGTTTTRGDAFTQPYAPPEVIAADSTGKDAAGAAATKVGESKRDAWSMGVLMLELFMRAGGLPGNPWGMEMSSAAVAAHLHNAARKGVLPTPLGQSIKQLRDKGGEFVALADLVQRCLQVIDTPPHTHHHHHHHHRHSHHHHHHYYHHHHLLHHHHYHHHHVLLLVGFPCTHQWLLGEGELCEYACESSWVGVDRLFIDCILLAPRSLLMTGSTSAS
jgi:hypothetical protein